MTEWKGRPKDWNHPDNVELRKEYGDPVYSAEYDRLRAKLPSPVPLRVDEEHLTRAERACLDALRYDQERWGGVITQELFTGCRRDLWLGVSRVEDPKDDLQVFDWIVAHPDKLETTWGQVAEEIAHPDYECPWHRRGAEWIEARLRMLQRRRDRKRLAAALSESADWLKEGVPTEDIESYIETMMQKQTSELGIFADVKVYTDEAPADEAPPERALVRGILYPKGISIMAGPGGIGKSWCALDIARALAQEMFFLGLPCLLENVAYLSLEMTTAQVRARVKKLGGIHTDRLFVVGQEKTGGYFEITDPAKQSALRFWLAQRNITVLIVDPLRNAHSVDENDSTEIAQVMQGFSRLGCAVLLLHHVNKGSGETRGSSAIRDRADAVVTIQRQDDHLSLHWEKKPRFDAVPDDIQFRIVEAPDGHMRVERLA
jgi:hypothetical protein